METETRELSSVSRGKIKSNSTDDWKNEKLFVPPLPPTNLRGCHVIRIQYDVFVSAKKWAHSDRLRSPLLHPPPACISFCMQLTVELKL